MDNQEDVKKSAFKKVQNLIQEFNNTFEIEATIIKDKTTNEEVTDVLKIVKLKNDGSVFLDEIFDTLLNMVHITSENHELVYDPSKKGFALARKKISYEII